MDASRLGELEKGTKYEVRYRLSLMRRDRKLVGTYRGIVMNTLDTVLQFSARPVAGTQQLPLTAIKDITKVHPNTPCYVGAKA